MDKLKIDDFLNQAITRLQLENELLALKAKNELLQSQLSSAQSMIGKIRESGDELSYVLRNRDRVTNEEISEVLNDWSNDRNG
jgi:hypothetical protein